MRILVTGVTGQIGSALVARLGPEYTLLPATRTELDLSRCADVAAALSRFNPDLIINPAAYTAVDRAEDEPQLANLINAQAPGHIALWAAERSVPIVHFSTDYVFSGYGEHPWRETDNPEPLSVYGESKLAGERAVQSAGGPHLIIRTSWVYAAKGRNFLRTIARLAQERQELRIVEDQIGAPTSARAIANILAKMLAGSRLELADRFAAAQGLVHLSAGGETSWFAFARSIIEGLHARGIELKAKTVVPIQTQDYPTKARRPANSRFRLSRLQDVFGIVPPSWEEALALELDALASELANSAD